MPHSTRIALAVLLGAFVSAGNGFARGPKHTPKDPNDLCSGISPDPATVTQFYENNPTYSSPASAQESWVTGTPESQGMRSDVLQQGVKKLQGVPQAFSFLVYRNGVLVLEQYLHKSKVTASNNVHSSSKSILSSLVGIAIQKGILKGLDQSIAEILAPKFSIAPDHRAITLRHLMTMTAGLDWTEDTTEDQIQAKPNWVQAILDLPLKNAPGSTFNYDTGLTHLTSAILTEASGVGTCTFARRNLFDPVGMTVQHWGRDPQGYYSGGYNVYLSARDLLKFGVLILQNGVWNGSPVVPPDWVGEMVQPQVEPTDQSDPTYAYGLFWWLPPLVPNHGIFKTWGYGGQFVYVVPSMNLVTVLTANTLNDYTEMDGDSFVQQYVLPAVATR